MRDHIECSHVKNEGLGMTEEKREGVCAVARSWLGTPYHHMGRVKGAGVDCAMFPLEVYRAAGIVDDIAVPYYPQDWMMHRSDEVYLGIVQRYAREIRQQLVASSQ